MKWLKRLLLLVVFLVVFAGALALAAWWLARGTPEWYGRNRSTPQQLAAAAQRAELEVQRTLSWASDQAHHPPSSTQPAQTFQITLTEDELNAFFQKWDNAFGWSDRYAGYLSDPQIVIQNGKLILAATVKDTNSVISIEFAPRLENGKLDLPVTRVLAGRLPLPQSFWDRYRQRLEAAMQSRLPEWQQRANITPDGKANEDTVAAAMSELLLDGLNDRPAEPVLFLPYDIRQNRKSLPVKLNDVQIAGKALMLTVQPMTGPQRQALLAHIRTLRPAEATRQEASNASPRE